MKRKAPQAGAPSSPQIAETPSSSRNKSSISVNTSDQGEPPRKVRRQSSKIMSVLRSLTNSASSRSIRDPSSPRASSEDAKSVGENSWKRPVGRKISLAALLSPNPSATVVRRPTPQGKGKGKARALLRSFKRITNENQPVSQAKAQQTPSPASTYDSNGQTQSSGKSSGPTNETQTTAKTSFESSNNSKLNSSKDTNSGDRVRAGPSTVVRSRDPELHSSPDSTLEPIEETCLDQFRPTIETVEKAAAAKIYLETYFNERLSKPSPRSLRLQYLEAQLYHSELSDWEKNVRRRIFNRQESNHLRETRVLKARSIGTLDGFHNGLADKYQVVKVLGKGSFGVVRLVRERSSTESAESDLPQARPRRPVYAMKVIRKSAMLRTSQEGHLRAERDFLVSSEGSRWIVPLISSFQDPANLYLVMEYMPSGDFLGLLIRENVLTESAAKFFLAEMILCVEEVHSLRCIHRDIKPDNFLVSASGHLKISDFGLAFDGHWSHDIGYFNTQRYSLVNKLGLTIQGDAIDRSEGLQGTTRWSQNLNEAIRKHELRLDSEALVAETREGGLDWRNRCGMRSAARSVVGTSQYMAPEWSLGIILYECLYGHTPFVSEEGGRQETKRNIVNHRETFAFPDRPQVSRHCSNLMLQLIQEKEERLCSRRYRFRDLALGDRTPDLPPRLIRHSPRDWTGRSVFPYDAEDIKMHRWFRDVDWQHLHLMRPPFVPRLSSVEDTRYFDEEESASDWSESLPDTTSEEDVASPHSVSLEPNPLNISNASPPYSPGLRTPLLPNAMVPRRNPQRQANMQAQLSAMPRNIRRVMAEYVATPYDSLRLRRIHRDIESFYPDNREEVEHLMDFVRRFGRKERRRPRDRLLRDRETRGVVLDVRKRSAFLGYTWTRMKAWDEAGVAEMMRSEGEWEDSGDGNFWLGGNGGGPEVATQRAWYSARASGR